MEFDAVPESEKIIRFEGKKSFSRRKIRLLDRIFAFHLRYFPFIVIFVLINEIPYRIILLAAEKIHDVFYSY